MKILTIGKNEYKLEYSFAAAENKEVVQKMFNMLSGAYLIKGNQNNPTDAMVDGVSEMVADIPHIAKSAFYAGLLENHEMSKDEAYELMKQYMKENKISYNKLYEDIKTCMEDDGFFDLSGLTEMIQTMQTGIEEAAKQKVVKTPQDRKKKSTSTK